MLVKKLRTNHGHCHSLLQSSHGLKKPLMLAKQGCNTQHGDANDVGVGAHVAKRTLTRRLVPSICTAGARKDCFSGVLPAALGVVPTKQSIVEQARAKSTQASTRELERAMS